MLPKVGLIFLDGTEVIIGIYIQNRDLRWTKLYSQVRDLTNFDSEKPIDYLDLVEILAESLLFGVKLNIKRWQVLSRNLSDEILKQISQATRVKVRSLDLKTEQELILKGVLNEL